jgi:drug/metabolite transporter (DMT)-like permease
MLETVGPILAALLYAFATFFVRRALRGGITIALQLGVTNLCMSLLAGTVALVVGRGAVLTGSPWPFLTALLFMLGQVLVIIALRVGDSSVQTPLMGLKTIFVALIAATAFGQTLGLGMWVAAGLSTVAVILIGYHPGTSRSIHALPILVTVSSTLLYAGSDTIVAELSGPMGSAPFLATFLLTVAICSVPLAVMGAAAQQRGLRDGTPYAALLWGSLLMALQFGLSLTVLTIYSDAPRMNVLYSTRGLWSVVLLIVLNRAGFGYQMEEISRRVMSFRLVGAGLLVVAVAVVV